MRMDIVFHWRMFPLPSIIKQKTFTATLQTISTGDVKGNTNIT